MPLLSYMGQNWLQGLQLSPNICRFPEVLLICSPFQMVSMETSGL